MNIKDDFYTDSFRFVNYVNLTEKESRAIWEGRNHPDVRKWMDNPDPFSWESHCQYIETLKEKTDRSYWAVFYGDEEIGSMCLNPIGDKWAETGMFLLPQHIGKGLGTRMKKEFIDFILKNTDIGTLNLKTQHSNIRVIKLNESLGYKTVRKDDTYVYMSKTR